MRANGVRWTVREDKLAQSYASEGFAPLQIAERLGRRERSVRERLQLLAMTAERRKTFLDKKRATSRRYAEAYHGIRKRALGYMPMKCVPAAEVLADRDLRATLVPRDLTAAFFGDPLPGYSALERA